MNTLHGTHLAHAPGDASRAQGGYGLASATGKLLRARLPGWMSDPRRACHDKPTSWWFGGDKDDDGEVLAAPDDVKTAERLCQGCRFRLDCGEYGLRNEPFGMWGGIKLNTLTGTQRRDRLAGIERERRRRTA